LKDAEESMERRLGLSEFQTDGTDTEKARDAKLESCRPAQAEMTIGNHDSLPRTSNLLSRLGAPMVIIYHNG